MNAAASSVASTAKPFAAPSCWIAAMPAGIESCRKPAVLREHEHAKVGAACAGAVAGKQEQQQQQERKSAPHEASSIWQEVVRYVRYA